MDSLIKITLKVRQRIYNKGEDIISYVPIEQFIQRILSINNLELTKYKKINLLFNDDTWKIQFTTNKTKYQIKYLIMLECSKDDMSHWFEVLSLK
ncbi:hypothetical protein [uncultured Clostridium sp.]|uniref:hypothetical protein n=1 Tax=uncultured Clostridium sp. TaxID=59620 RepID=UPI00260859B7|nr:hypothetical protein [uncultured Clostridium sp.]